MEKDSPLYRAASIALKEYMGLAPEETLLIITDEIKRSIGEAFFEAGKDICSDAFLTEMKSRDFDSQEPPTPIAEMMRSVDVVICPTAKSLTHTNARRDASRVGVRIATLPDASADSLIRCINDDYDKVADTCRIVANALKGSTVVKVTTKEGTDISFSSFETRIMQNTGLMRNIGENGNLPAGEVFLAPVDGSMNGTIIFDASFGSIGLLNDNVKIIIKDGMATRFYGKATGKAISGILKQFGDDALKIGEFGIGTNHTAQISGNIVEDEKVLGTVHFAFGNNLAMGGKISVPIHLDGVVRNPDIYVDGNLIMKDGVLQLHED